MKAIVSFVDLSWIIFFVGVKVKQQPGRMDIQRWVTSSFCIHDSRRFKYDAMGILIKFLF